MNMMYIWESEKVGYENGGFIRLLIMTVGAGEQMEFKSIYLLGRRRFSPSTRPLPGFQNFT